MSNRRKIKKTSLTIAPDDFDAEYGIVLAYQTEGAKFDWEYFGSTEEDIDRDLATVMSWAEGSNAIVTGFNHAKSKEHFREDFANTFDLMFGERGRVWPSLDAYATEWLGMRLIRSA